MKLTVFAHDVGFFGSGHAELELSLKNPFLLSIVAGSTKVQHKVARVESSLYFWRNGSVEGLWEESLSEDQMREWFPLWKMWVDATLLGVRQKNRIDFLSPDHLYPRNGGEFELVFSFYLQTEVP